MSSIENFASKIQALPPQLRWVSAQDEIIMRVGTCPPRGRGGIWADRFVLWAGWLSVDRAAVAGATFVLSLGLFFRQYSTRSKHDLKSALFVGIDALREPPLVEEFEKICKHSASRLDERDLKTFFSVQRINLSTIISEWADIWREIWSELGSAGLQRGLDRHYQLSFLLRVGHKFTYLRAWFRQYLRTTSSGSIVGFSAAGYTAAAAVAAGAKAIYFQHGFQRRSIVYPDFAECYCFNRYDAEHFQTRLPSARVVVRSEPFEVVKSKRVMAIAGIYGEPEAFELSRSVIEWALNIRIPVVVRPHPQDHTGYWKQWMKAPGICVLNEQWEFDKFLSEVQPRLLVSWFSTTLFDALRRGSVPVTLSSRAHDADDVVFPFRRIAIRWPDDQRLLQQLVEDPQACVELTRQRYLDATAPLRSRATQAVE